MIRYETSSFWIRSKSESIPTGAMYRWRNRSVWKGEAEQSKQTTSPCYDTNRGHWTCQLPIFCWASQHPELEGGWTVQAEHGQGPSSLREDPVGVESNQHPRQFECHLPAQAFHLSKSLPTSPGLFPLWAQSLPFLRWGTSQTLWESPCLHIQTKSLFMWEPRQSSAGLLARCRRCCHALRCRASPEGETHPTGAESRCRHVHVCRLLLGSCSPKLKQALAEILVPLDLPFLDVGSGTEPHRLVWSRKRAESQQEYSWWVRRGTGLLCTHQGAQGGMGCPFCLSFFRSHHSWHPHQVLGLASNPLPLPSLQALHPHTSDRPSSEVL